MHTLKERKATQPLVSNSEKDSDPGALLKRYLTALGVPETACARGKLPALPSSGKIWTSCHQIQLDSGFLRSMLEHRDSTSAMEIARVDPISAVLQKLVNRSDASASRLRRRQKQPQRVISDSHFPTCSTPLRTPPCMMRYILTSVTSALLLFCETLSRAVLEATRAHQSCQTFELVYELLHEASDLHSNGIALTNTSIEIAAKNLRVCSQD